MADKVRVPAAFFEELAKLYKTYKDAKGEYYGECNVSYTTELGNSIKGSIFPISNGKLVVEIEINNGD